MASREACRLVMRQMKVVLRLHGERGARLLDGEMFVELLLSWRGCVHVMRERLEGRSTAKRHGGLSVNACSNMQVAGAATCRLQDISLGCIMFGSVWRPVVAPSLTCIEPMTTNVSKAATTALLVTIMQCALHSPTPCGHPVWSPAKQPLPPDAKGTMHTSASALKSSCVFSNCIQSVARCSKVRFSAALWSEVLQT